MVYPALQPLIRTPRLPVVDWTDAPADLNGLVRFAERRNPVSALVPSHFNWPLETAVPLGLNFYLSITFYSRTKRLTHCANRSTLTRARLTHCANGSTLTRARNVKGNDRQLVTPREAALCHNIYIVIFIVRTGEGILLTGKPLSSVSWRQMDL